MIRVALTTTDLLILTAGRPLTCRQLGPEGLKLRAAVTGETGRIGYNEAQRFRELLLANPDRDMQWLQEDLEILDLIQDTSEAHPRAAKLVTVLISFSSRPRGPWHFQLSI